MKKNKLVFGSILLVIMLFIAGCGGNNEIDASGDNKTIRMHLSTDPTTFDPALNGDFLTSALLRNMYEGLVRIDENNEIVNALATNIDISDDGLTYTFELRESNWSNGDPVTAKDFEYAWKRILDPELASGKADILYLIKGAKEYFEGDGTDEDLGINVLSDYELEVVLENPAPYFLELLTGSHFMPVNIDVAEADDDWAADTSNFVSNGPFKLTSYKIKDEVILEKNEEYWDADNVEIETVEYVLIEDNNTALNMFEKGELDWIGAPVGGLPGEALDSLRQDELLHSATTASTTTIMFHMEQEPFNNVNIRKAFSYAVNRADITEHTLQGGQEPVTGIVPATMLLNEEGYFKDNDVDEAKKLLDKGMEELGLTEFPSITYLYIASDTGHKLAQTLQAQLKDHLGVEITLESLEAKVFFDAQEAEDRTHHFSFAGWTADYNDPIDLLQSYMVDEYENEAFDDLLDQARKEPDVDKRDQILLEAETMLIEDMPIIPMYSGANNWVKNEKLKGIYVTSISHYELKGAYFED